MLGRQVEALDEVLLDIGSGSFERISAMKIPFNYLDKVFIGHLHSDHFGDLDGLYCGGIVANRVVPLRVWGPSSIEPKYGTKVAIEHFEKMLAWDIDTRVGNTDTRGAFIDVTEFDYTAVNEVIYQDNGVTIRTIPAIHIFDGAVSFILEWNGLKFAYSSDTFPNKWWMEHTKGSDIAIHECFVAVTDLVKKMGFTPERALLVGTQIHTAPEAFGKIMTDIQPRMAVAYHFFKDFDTTAAVNDRIRTTYDGPLSLAEDFMVWNITQNEIRVRMAVVEEHTWAPPLVGKPELPRKDDRKNYGEEMNVPVDSLGYSDFIQEGRWAEVDEALRGVYKEASEALGRDFPYPADE